MNGASLAVGETIPPRSATVPIRYEDLSPDLATDIAESRASVVELRSALFWTRFALALAVLGLVVCLVRVFA